MMSSIKQEAAKHISLRRINVAFNLILKLHLYVHIYIHFHLYILRIFSFLYSLFLPIKASSKCLIRIYFDDDIQIDNKYLLSKLNYTLHLSCG